MKKSFLCVAFLLAIALCACTKQSADIKQPGEPSEATGQGSASAGGDTQPTPETTMPTDAPPEQTKTVVTAPTADEVYAARERALAGMTDDQINSLTEFVKRANLWLEYGYLSDRFFDRLSDPDSLEWNYFHQTGEIQTGWAYSTSIDKEAVCEAEGLTENEFYEKYAAGVVANNAYNADGFVSKLNSLRENVSDEALIADLQYIMDESLLAKDTHDATHVYNLYRTLHDMDYFLLRYGPEDVGPYVRDASTVSKYYGTLSMYSDVHDE